MTVEIDSRSVDSETEKRIVLSAYAIARTMSIGDDWNAIQIGIRLSTARASSYTAPAPKWYFGLTNGTAAPPGSVTPNHFYGVLGNGTEGWFYDGTADMIETGISSCRIVNGTESSATVGTQTTSNNRARIGGLAKRTAIFVRITKGSPYAIRIWQTIGLNTSASDLSSAEFETILRAGTPVENSRGIYEITTPTSYAIDEATNGILNSVCFSWLAADELEINDIGWVRIS